jgi:hypothetical protein
MGDRKKSSRTAREKLAEKLKPLFAGLDSAGPGAEGCPICHQALLPEIGRCNIFHQEADFDLVKNRFIKGTQLPSRGWSIPRSQGGYHAGANRFLGEPLAFLPRKFDSTSFDMADCIALYSKTDVEAVEQTLEFRAFLQFSRKKRGARDL